ncbi:NADH:flavin oxidoreductase [Spongiibacter sp. KMU-166]|uniref:NADH:flavin oxidoreductase n=1 Tax=Spongiibacter thalassae TaxID=2721624 RepID=A0ABX1GGV5_9GAMM|nr:NADH:flavin oxidoreductase [Spongiibacter thalassae]NKI18191.1 NADH:flavin oxidoreductase [Spongiibacter thalassae]
MSQDAFFQTFQCKSLTLRNRFAMAPMTRSGSPGGVVSDTMRDYYQRRAAGGVGLIISEGTGINRPGALNDKNVPRFHGEAELAAWQQVVEAVHAAGGAFVPQLWHVGAMRAAAHADPISSDILESPSGLAMAERPRGLTMSDSDIADCIDAFAQAALDAKNIGCDGAEFHGAHGYLIDEFFWGPTNQRSDRYGGKSLVERSRFAVEILQAARKAVGEDFALILRVSQWKQQDYTARLAETPAEMEAWLGALSDAGADIFHCSQRRFWEPEFDGSSMNFAGWAKKLTGKPSITVGSVGLESDFLGALTHGESAQQSSGDRIHDLQTRFERGEFDLIAVGRALLQDANWVQKLQDGRVDEFEDFDIASMMAIN